jgi:hypothetical protein
MSRGHHSKVEFGRCFIPPRRRNSRTRSSLACRIRGISSTSSRKSVPRSASSKTPRFWARASVNAAFFVAEQLAFQQSGGVAVYGDQRLGPPERLKPVRSQGVAMAHSSFRWEPFHSSRRGCVLDVARHRPAAGGFKSVIDRGRRATSASENANLADPQTVIPRRDRPRVNPRCDRRRAEHLAGLVQKPSRDREEKTI